jgi:ferredoxin
MMKAIVDKETCTGCGLCIDTCPNVFQMEGDVATVTKTPVPDEDYVSCRDAAEQCPVEAIKIVE